MKVIITADWHLRKDTPRCRIDEDWMECQRLIITEILDTAVIKECYVYIIGDIFHTTQVHSSVINLFLNVLKDPRYEDVVVGILPGNHDLPYNNEDLINDCSLGVLLNGKGITQLANNSDISDFQFIHELVFPDEKSKPHPDIEAKTAQEILNAYPNRKWIFVGDYHHAFHYEKNGRHVVNPGCITRQAADFIDYKPSVYLVDTDTEEVEQIFLPDMEPLVVDSYLKEEKERNERITSFVENIKKKGTVSLSFRDNLKANLQDSKIKTETKNIVKEILEEL